MDCGIIQNGVTLRHPQKAGALLKRLGAQLGHLQQLLPCVEGAVFFPIGHDIFGGGGVQPSDMGEQRRGSGVHIGANGVDAVLHHAAQGGVQAGGRHIVLILTHADGFGIDLHQLCQRVLQTSGDGNGRAQIHIILPQLLRCQLRGGIDGCACLTDYHVRDGQVFLLDGLHDKLLRFPSAGAVANGCVLDMVRLHQLL